jgi:hypothetical protein
MMWNKPWTWICLVMFLGQLYLMHQAQGAGEYDKATFEALWAAMWAYLLSLQSKPTETKP